MPCEVPRFLAYLSRCWLRRLKPGNLVITDNLPAHKGGAVRAIIEATGARLMLLPYSPDFNPIENAFAKLKGRVVVYKDLITPEYTYVPDRRTIFIDYRSLAALLKRLGPQCRPACSRIATRTCLRHLRLRGSSTGRPPSRLIAPGSNMLSGLEKAAVR